MTVMKCAQCGENLETEKDKGWIASISGSIMGDEVTDTYYFCGGCGAYTLEVSHDRFLGREDVPEGTPVPEEEGNQRVRLIGKCPDPWDKKCRCDAHREYFGGCLD
jgi:hypothetical protein